MNHPDEAKVNVEEGGKDEKTSWQNGVVTGIAGKRIGVNGVLDLRGVPEGDVAGIESLKVNGVVLLDEANRSALAGVKSTINGSVVVADPDMRLIIEPEMKLSRATVEAMPAGQKLMLIGNIFFQPDVPAALVAEKFERLHVVGVLIACEGVYGALMGKMERTGVSITLPDDVGRVVRSVGKSDWTQDYLSRLDDGTTYINMGKTTVPENIDLGLIERKIVAYHNLGKTVCSEPVAALLKSRCPTDHGRFSTPENG